MLGIYRYMLEWLFLIRKIFQPPKIFLKLLVREFLNMGVPGSLKVSDQLFDDQSDQNTILLQRLYVCT